MKQERTADPGAPFMGRHGPRAERLELHLTYRCPNRCCFCSEAHRMAEFRDYPVSWGRVATVLRTHARRGVRSLHLTGGEPTIHPRFVDVLVLARKLGMHTSIGTNGARLCRETFAAKALPHLDEAMFSLHGPDSAAHDALTGRDGSFEQVTGAITRCRQLQPNFGIHVNVVVTRRNLEAISATVALAGELGARLIVVSNLAPEGRGMDDYAALAVPLEELAVVLPGLPLQAPNALVRFFGVPMCLLAEQAMLSNDLHWDPRVTVEWQRAPRKVVLANLYGWDPGRKRVRPPNCDPCSRRGVCMGVFDRYAELFSTEALRPLLEVREEPGCRPH